MQKVKLENEKLEITVNIHGAELSSIREKKNDTQYLWNADPKYWNRSSPVLFPFVGGVKDKVYRHEGVEYPMNQHGFARDMDFDLLSQTENEVWFALDATEETKKVYPFDFHLEIGYHLEENAVKVMWKVKNTDDKRYVFCDWRTSCLFLSDPGRRKTIRMLPEFQKSRWYSTGKIL